MIRYSNYQLMLQEELVTLPRWAKYDSRLVTSDVHQYNSKLCFYAYNFDILLHG